MKLLILLIIVLLVAFALWPRQPTPPVEETFIAPQLEPLNKAKQVEEQYMDALERADGEIEKQSDGG
jgi:hypothetical protein